MNKERSAGAVLYKIADNKLYYLIEHMGLGHISIPKGHLEKDETLQQACIREIKEETNLEKIDWDFIFQKTITYLPHFKGQKNEKDVTFFVGKVLENTKPVDLHDKEVSSIEYLPFKEALEKITYPLDKETLTEANNYILKKENLL